MAKAAYGVSYIKLGPAGVNGAMGAVMTAIPAIGEGTANIDFPEPTVTEFIPEDFDSPFVSLSKPGVKKIVFETQNMDVDQMVLGFGGAVTAGSFKPGIQFSMPPKSLEFKTRPATGVSQIWKFPLVSVVASISGTLTRTGLLSLKFTCSVLTPIDAGGDPMEDFEVVQA